MESVSISSLSESETTKDVLFFAIVETVVLSFIFKFEGIFAFKYSIISSDLR